MLPVSRYNGRVARVPRDQPSHYSTHVPLAPVRPRQVMKKKKKKEREGNIGRCKERRKKGEKKKNPECMPTPLLPQMSH